MHAIRRNLLDKLNRYLGYFPVVAILGVRQSGKTTLARMARPDWDYFDLERGEDYDHITNDFSFFFKEHDEQVIIDEAQLSSQLLSEIRHVVDADRGKKGRFIITGSSSPELLRAVSETLAGRIGLIELGTLKANERFERPISSLYEILNGAAPKDQLELLKKLEVINTHDDVMRHFLSGGYPEPALSGDTDFSDVWMENYFNTYVQRDIRRLFPRMNADNYRRFIGMLAELSGTIVNRAEIARSLGASEPTVMDYLDIAQGTFVWRNLPSLERSRSKSVIKMPRGYIRDSGLLHHILKIKDRDTLLRSSGVGAAFEAFVIEEIINGFMANITDLPEFHYFRTRNGAEVDLIIDTASNRIPVEVKFGTSTKRQQLMSLSQFIERERLEYGILINNDDRVTMLTDNIIQLPAGAL
jgi:predicted AAA+ superfamily ATPase